MAELRAQQIATRLAQPLAVIATVIPVLAIAAGPASLLSTPTTAKDRELEEITVFATPLGGLEMSIDRVPGNVQRATGDRLESVRRAGLAQSLEQRLGSISINAAQANPLQPDVLFRGFVASPLLGQPQGVAVYQNGVRINDPFGDIVQWALMPESAIATIDVIPGSNPVFGLNALGGALSLRTKTGFTDPGDAAEAMYGSADRITTTIESGGEFAQSFSYYGNARYLKESGWRDHSPSDALHLFGDLGWRNARSSTNLNLTRIETDLTGNGPSPVQLLEVDRDAVYTHPDRTQNSLTFFTLSGSHRFNSDIEWLGVAYSRRSDIDSLNGDESPFEACEFDADFLCDEDDTIAHDVEDNPIAFDDAVDGATLNRGMTRQATHGVSMQVGITTPFARRDNRLIAGTSYDRSRIRFRSDTELARFDDSRGAIGSSIHVDQSQVDLRTHIESASVFLTDTYSISPRLDLTLSGRYNATRIRLTDQIGTALNGDHDFSRLNGAGGIVFRAREDVTLYASYSESNRVPSPVELTCADEDDPCALPNSFLSDPPLEQVVARTSEVGARGSWRSLRWHAGLFRTNNDDDILFVSAGTLTNRGFFENVGTTRRQGIELNLSGKLGPMTWFANYTRLQAEFRKSFRVMSPHNPQSSRGEIEVMSGARLPGVPEQMLKAGLSVALTGNLSIDLDAAYQSDQIFRGDEANVTPALPGHTVFNAALQLQVSGRLTLFAQLENVFDQRYETFGLYGAADEVLGDAYRDDPRFVSPAAPRSAWLGIRWGL